MSKLYKYLIIESPSKNKSEKHLQKNPYLSALKDTIVNNLKTMDAPIELNENQ